MDAKQLLIASTLYAEEKIHDGFIRPSQVFRDAVKWAVGNYPINWINPEVELPPIEEEDFSIEALVYADGEDSNYGTHVGLAWYDFSEEKWTFVGDWAPERKVIAWARIVIPDWYNKPAE